MPTFGETLHHAFGLIGRFDRELVDTILLSLRVSMSATVIAFMVGAPVGAMLAVSKSHASRGVVLVAHALLGLPPVVVGLIVYLALSRAGPLGSFGLLFTPAAMVIAQTTLALPIVIALTHRACSMLWAEFGDALLMDGARPHRAALTLLAIARAPLVTVFLAAFGRSLAEVGAIIIVGGNIRGVTRTMTTTIALETSRGDLSLALALGIVLIAISLSVSVAGFALARTPAR